jgi:hypothetical protein
MAKAPVKEEVGGLPQRQSSQNFMVDMPDFLKEKKGTRGTELIEGSDMTMPRLAICQSTNPQRKKTNAKYIEGLEEGDIFNSLTGNIYEKPVHIIPLFFYKSRILFKDIDEGGGVLCMSNDAIHCPLNHGGICLHNQWGQDGTPPECTELYNFAVIVKETRELAVLSLKSTGIKAAKDLNSMIRMRKRDAFAGVYAINTVADKKHNQDFFAVTATNAGWNSDPELFKFCEEAYEALAPKVKAGEIGMDVEGAESELSESDKAFADRETSSDDEL